MAANVDGLSSTQDRAAAFALDGRPFVMVIGFADRVVCLPPARHESLVPLGCPGLGSRLPGDSGAGRGAPLTKEIEG